MVPLSRCLRVGALLGLLNRCGGDAATPPVDAAGPVGDMPPDVTYPPDGGDTSCGRATTLGCDESKAGSNSGGANWIDLHGCATAPNSGPETYYSFISAADRIVTVDLAATDNAQDLDLFVLDAACAATGCLDQSLKAAGEIEQVRFAATADVEYRIVVDGYLGGAGVGAGDYTISVACASLECEPSTAVVDCATTGLSGNNAQVGSTDAHELYGCGGDTAGQEYIYTFVPAVDGQVTVTLDIAASSVDLDLFVLEDTGGGCNVGECITASMTQFDQVVHFDATIGRTYYLVVDGVGTDSGDYLLTIECAGVLPDGGPIDGGPTDGSSD